MPQSPSPCTPSLRPALWGQKEQTAFDLLKARLCAAPTLAYPRRERRNIVDCDASDVAAGAVYMQVTEEGEEVVIQYASYTFSGAEVRWPIMEKEAYAVVWAVSTFRSYLLGSPVTIRNDNSAVSTLKTAKHAKLKRWAIMMEEFEYTIVHRAGKLQSHVDALSRLPTTQPRLPAPPELDTPTATLALAAQTAQSTSSNGTADASTASCHPNLQQLDWPLARARDSDYQALWRHLSAEEGGAGAQTGTTGKNQDATRDAAATGRPPQWFAMLPQQQ